MNYDNNNDGHKEDDNDDDEHKIKCTIFSICHTKTSANSVPILTSSHLTSLRRSSSESGNKQS